MMPSIPGIWALSAILLREHMKEEADLTKVMVMVLIHDLVEIDAGGYLCL